YLPRRTTRRQKIGAHYRSLRCSSIPLPLAEHFPSTSRIIPTRMLQRGATAPAHGAPRMLAQHVRRRMRTPSNDERHKCDAHTADICGVKGTNEVYTVNIILIIRLLSGQGVAINNVRTANIILNIPPRRKIRTLEKL